MLWGKKDPAAFIIFLFSLKDFLSFGMAYVKLQKTPTFLKFNLYFLKNRKKCTENILEVIIWRTHTGHFHLWRWGRRKMTETKLFFWAIPTSAVQGVLLIPPLSAPPSAVLSHGCEKQIRGRGKLPRLTFTAGGSFRWSPSPGLSLHSWVPKCHPSPPHHPPPSMVTPANSRLKSGWSYSPNLFLKQTNKKIHILELGGLSRDGRGLDSRDFSSSACFAAAFYIQVSHFRSCRASRARPPLFPCQGRCAAC